MTPENLDPTPKNPVVANFFTQMGRSEELGSGGVDYLTKPINFADLAELIALAPGGRSAMRTVVDPVEEAEAA